MPPADNVDRAQEVETAWRRERPDLDPSSVRVVTRVWQLAKVFGDVRRQLLTSYGIDPAVMDLLGTLRRSGEPFELSTRALAGASGVTPGAISQRLSRAEASGWVTRRQVAARTVLVTLTDQGRQVVDDVAGAIFARDDELLSSLGHDQREALADLLAHLVAAVGPASPLPHVGDYDQMSASRPTPTSGTLHRGEG